MPRRLPHADFVASFITCDPKHDYTLLGGANNFNKKIGNQQLFLSLFCKMTDSIKLLVISKQIELQR